MSTATGLVFRPAADVPDTPSNHTVKIPGQQGTRMSTGFPSQTLPKPYRVPAYTPSAFRNGFAPAGQRPERRPQGPRFVRRMSELIDPVSIAQIDAVVQSPSGSLLSYNDFANREDRPLSLRERQEKIRRELERRANLAAAPKTDVEKDEGRSSKGFDSPESTQADDADPHSTESPNCKMSWKWRWLCCSGCDTR